MHREPGGQRPYNVLLDCRHRLTDGRLGIQEHTGRDHTAEVYTAVTLHVLHGLWERVFLEQGQVFTGRIGDLLWKYQGSKHVH